MIFLYNLSKLNYSYDYLNQQLRQKGVFDINKVELGVLKPSDELSINLKSENRPLTPQNIHLSTQYAGLATEIILYGKILKHNLRKNHLNKEWLYKELNKNCKYNENDENIVDNYVFLFYNVNDVSIE